MAKLFLCEGENSLYTHRKVSTWPFEISPAVTKKPPRPKGVPHTPKSPPPRSSPQDITTSLPGTSQLPSGFPPRPFASDPPTHPRSEAHATMMGLPITYLFFLLLISFRIGSVLPSLVPSSADGGAAGVIVTAKDGTQHLLLSDSFNLSHPALDIAYMIELRRTGQPLPTLPGVPSALLHDTQEHRWTTAPSPKGFCDTSDASPNQSDVIALADELISIGRSGAWCCRKAFDKTCTLMLRRNTASSDLCHWECKKVCVSCKKAGEGIKEVALKCGKNGKTGGRMRYMVFFFPPFRLTHIFGEQFIG